MSSESPARASDPPQVIEVTEASAHLLPGGKEADGIIGDFVLRNELVEAVISHNAPHRKANMSTFWGAGGDTPGCLYDLTLRGSDNDQITIFSPLKQRGPVSYVRVFDTGSADAAAVETVTTAGKNNGRSVRHEYRVTRGWPGVIIRSTVGNATAEPMKVETSDEWTRFRSAGTWLGVHWADAIDPADRTGYAYQRLVAADDGAPASGAAIQLAPGASASITRLLAVGRSPAEAVGRVLARIGDSGRVTGRLVGPGDEPVSDATIQVGAGGDLVPLYPDHTGAFSVELPPGDYDLAAATHGRTGAKASVSVRADSETTVTLRLGPLSGAQFVVTDNHGRSIPCKVQFVGLDGTDTPNLGPGDRAHGCADQYHSEQGRFFVALDPGRYRVTITRGVEYGHHREQIEIAAGKRAEIRARLTRLVDTRGWVSTDFHNHSTPSGDNTCGTDDRLINLTTGPFLRVQAGDGTPPGGSTRASDSVQLSVHVQCTDWIDIDRIQVLVNGRQEPSLNFTRTSHPDWFGDGVTKFDRTIDVPLSRDSHLIVVAYGENFDLSTGYGTSPQSGLKPCAYHNPIFVDTDGGGFQPSLDLLGFPLPTKGLSVEEARALLK